MKWVRAKLGAMSSKGDPVWPLFVIMPALFAVILWLAYRNDKKGRANLRRLAEKLGLTYYEPRARLGIFSDFSRADGLRQGRRACLFNYSTGSGKSRVTWSAVEVVPRARGNLSFSLQRPGLGTKLGAWFGRARIMTGDPEFDQSWVVKTNAPEFILAALVPELRERLVAVTAMKPRGAGVVLKEEGLRYYEQGRFANDALCARFEILIDLVGDLAAVVEVYAEQPPEVRGQ